MDISRARARSMSQRRASATEPRRIRRCFLEIALERLGYRPRGGVGTSARGRREISLSMDAHGPPPGHTRDDHDRSGRCGGLGCGGVLRRGREQGEGLTVDDERFDGWIRSLGNGTSRRGALGILAGLAGLGLGEVAAKQHRRRGAPRPRPECGGGQGCRLPLRRGGGYPRRAPRQPARVGERARQARGRFPPGRRQRRRRLLHRRRVQRAHQRLRPRCLRPRDGHVCGALRGRRAVYRQRMRRRVRRPIYRVQAARMQLLYQDRRERLCLPPRDGVQPHLHVRCPVHRGSGLRLEPLLPPRPRPRRDGRVPTAVRDPRRLHL
jgi:hypothetical protein